MKRVKRKEKKIPDFVLKVWYPAKLFLVPIMSVVRNYWSLVNCVAVVSEGVGGYGGLFVGVKAGVVGGNSNVSGWPSFEGNGGDLGGSGGGEEVSCGEVFCVRIDLPVGSPLLVVEGWWGVRRLGGSRKGSSGGEVYR
jgi:hypothetical protein